MQPSIVPSVIKILGTFRMRMSPISTASWRAALPDLTTPIGLSRGNLGDPLATAAYERLSLDAGSGLLLQRAISNCTMKY